MLFGYRYEVYVFETKDFNLNASESHHDSHVRINDQLLTFTHAEDLVGETSKFEPWYFTSDEFDCY